MSTRIRRTTLAASVVAASTLLLAGPASAAETIGACVFEETLVAEEEFGSLHALEEGDKADLEDFENKLEDCLEAPSPIIPEIDEIIWGGAAFLVLFGFMAWKGFPAVKGAMDARAERIRADLDAADKAKTDALRVQSDYEAQLADAKAEATRIVDEARNQADALKSDLQRRAEVDIAQMRERAAAEVELARRQAITDLRGEVSEIALGAAERVVGSSLDRSAQSALVDAYIDEMVGGRG